MDFSCFERSIAASASLSLAISLWANPAAFASEFSARVALDKASEVLPEGIRCEPLGAAPVELNYGAESASDPVGHVTLRCRSEGRRWSVAKLGKASAEPDQVTIFKAPILEGASKVSAVFIDVFGSVRTTQLHIVMQDIEPAWAEVRTRFRPKRRVYSGLTTLSWSQPGDHGLPQTSWLLSAEYETPIPRTPLRASFSLFAAPLVLSNSRQNDSLIQLGGSGSVLIPIRFASPSWKAAMIAGASYETTLASQTGYASLWGPVLGVQGSRLLGKGSEVLSNLKFGLMMKLLGFYPLSNHRITWRTQFAFPTQSGGRRWIAAIEPSLLNLDTDSGTARSAELKVMAGYEF